MDDAKILLIVDEDQFSELASRFSEASPVQLFQSSNLEKALATARSERPNLILLDADSPDLDAADFCAAFKADDELRAMPLIALTSSVRDGDAESLRKAGCDDILAKSLDDNLFFKKLSHYKQFVLQRRARVPVYTHVTIQDRDDVYYGMTGDISVGGLFVATFDRLPEKGEIRLSFVLQKEDPALFEVKGQVVWVNSKKSPVRSNIPEGFGLEFTNLSGAERSALKEFIAAAIKKSHS
jgi:two-component system cell cycle response regulator DivK